MHKKLKSGAYKAWVCFENNQRGLPKDVINDKGETINVGCAGKRVNDRVLQTAIHDIITQIIVPNKDEICQTLYKELSAKYSSKANASKITSLERKLERRRSDIVALTDKYVRDIVKEEAYIATSNVYTAEIRSLETEIAKLKSDSSNAKADKALFDSYIAQIEEIASIQESDINECLYERITKKIVVHPNQILEIHLSFMTKAVFLHYETKGRGDGYSATFTVVEI